MGRSISIDIPHRLPLSQVKDRVTQGVGVLAGYVGRHGSVQSGWSGDTLHVTVSTLGQKATGIAAVGASEIAIRGTVPILLAPFASRVEDMIAAQAPAFLASKQVLASASPSGKARRRGHLKKDGFFRRLLRGRF